MKNLLKLLAKGDARAELLVYGDIGEFFTDGVTAKGIVSQLQALKAPELLVRINSYGGVVSEGLAIYNALRAYPGVVTTRIEGFAASIASVIALAGARVEMADSAMLMIHQCSGGAWGTAQDLESAAESARKTNEILAGIYARKTGRTADEELDLLKTTGDRWLTAPEALAEKYVDAVFVPDEQTAHASAPTVAAAIESYLPTFAGADPARLGVLTAHLKRAQTAALAAPPQKTQTQTQTQTKRINPMNWLMLAKAYGLTADTDEAARAALLAHFALEADATDAALTAAIAAAAPATARAPAAPAAPAAPSRDQQIRDIFATAKIGRSDHAAIDQMMARALIGGDSVEVVKARTLDFLAQGEPVQGGVVTHTAMGTDQRDKLRDAGVKWLMARSGALPSGGEDYAKATQGNPFVRASLHDMARMCLENAGTSTRHMNRYDLITAAITSSQSDFPHIFENALHKTLIRGFNLQEHAWPQIARVTTLSDFRPHIRYRSGSISDIQVRDENGEYKTLNMGDAERETITAVSRGGIVNVTREMLINDDMSVFSDIALRLGQASARTLEKAVFALFKLNSGFGPTMGDSKPLFHADHGNIASSAGAPSVATMSAARKDMSKQKEPGGNDYLNIFPRIFLGSLATGDAARVVINSEYDPDTANKLHRFNVARGMVQNVVESPYLDDQPWYLFADPNVEPVIEVGFLDGLAQPTIESQEAWTQAGTSWRVLFDFGVAATGFRGAIRNAGA